jgi:hypothetical protein
VYTKDTLLYIKIMTTKTIGIKDFRANISEYAKKAQKESVRFIVMNHNKPLFEIKPFDEDADLVEIFSDIQKAREDVKNGRVYTQEDVLKEFV